MARTNVYEYVTDDRAREWLLINGDDDAVEKHLGAIEPERGPGRPEIGPEVKFRAPPTLIARLDAVVAATQSGTSRADTIRDLLGLALSLRIASVDVVTGAITVNVPDAEDTDVAHINGQILGLCHEIEPWGAEESGMDRADAGLTGMGWQRIGPWRGTPGETWTAPVEPAS